MAISDQDFLNISRGDLYSLLRSSSDEDLGFLVDYILRASTETLSRKPEYESHHPRHACYAGLIGDEIRAFGGNTFANSFRGEGPPYEEIVVDICRRMKVKPTEDVVENEKALLTKTFADAWEKLSTEEREAFLQEAGCKTGSLSAATPITVILGQLGTKFGASLAYRMGHVAADAAAKQLLGRGLAAAANVTLTRTAGTLIGPIGWVLTGVWTAIELAGPAYRVTVPCVLHIAYLRQKVLFGEVAAAADID